ncbi:MAG TPA: RluA family pseudouridine synthase [Leptolyngbyaceae cyanobacterium M33_DOE_097]|uniref:RNA pseudouridylate synthase n=1 Tax=Oscillatoriales cyanobacterium SpSt-418 TaxID=2282169 RepID=A0A7C3PG09_9CYAN|nr:RluA family pseudouridine synthase [Leptolyngbyaceae cyanobacterium M33_DOE_097]
MLFPISQFLPQTPPLVEQSPTYWYGGQCPLTNKWVQLPRTPFVEAIAQGLMQQLAAEPFNREGKMYGVLLVETPTGEKGVLKAFSGLLNGAAEVAGWVPPIPGREQVALAESSTLTALEAIKQELLALAQRPEPTQYQQLLQAWGDRWQHLTSEHKQRKQARQQQRQAAQSILSKEDYATLLAQLEQQSQQDGIERRRFKQQRDAVLQPLQAVVEQIAARQRELRQQRKTLSRELQTQMHTVYRLTNFAGISLPLQTLMESRPTGTGECCAPKLLHYAATHQLTPLAMAEFWWGNTTRDRTPGEFYGACVERCQPLMGFLLSGLTAQVQRSNTLTILYEDEWLIAVDKPSGLLSVPGRYRDRLDSVLLRLQERELNSQPLYPAHRLDQDTSGILVFAKDPDTHRQLNRQFQQRTIQKIYEAILQGIPTETEGVIDLPLWADPSDRPRQKVNDQLGKPSITHFQVLTSQSEITRIEFYPLTGRTHQLRVHAAKGLGTPILGDRLYGTTPTNTRLHLHARELTLNHPQTHQPLHLSTPTPF